MSVSAVDSMNELKKVSLGDGEAWAHSIAKGQHIRITATHLTHLICFNAADITERFDQARSKVYNMKVWASTGDALYSKLNNPMMVITRDDFAGRGRHDLQLTYGSAARLAAAPESVDARQFLTQALEPWNVAAERIPAALNLFLDIAIDMTSGNLTPTSIRPSAPTKVELEATMDLIVAIASGSDPAGMDQAVRQITVYSP